MRQAIRSPLLAALLAVPAAAQCFAVTTTTVAGNGNNGTMFDVVNTSTTALTITSLDQCFFAAGTAVNVSIYTKAGSWNGAQQTPAAWTLVGTTANLAHGAAPLLDALPIPLNLVLAAGATQGFYVVADAGTTVAYTTGIGQLGAVIGQDANLQVRAGVGVAGTFGSVLGLSPADGRLWNGRVNYCPVGSGTVLATATTIGAGCVRRLSSFYERHATAATAATALGGHVLELTPTPDGYQGSWLPGAAAAAYVPPTSATALATGDDGVVTVPLTTGTLATPQGAMNQVLVSGNGIVSWGGATIDTPGTSSYLPTVPGFLGSTLGGVYAWHDYNQAEAGSGPIVAEESGGQLRITFQDVESYPLGVANRSTLQFQLQLATGVIRVVFVAIDGNTQSPFGSTHLIGTTAPGASTDPGSIALATASATQLRTAWPELLPLTITATSRPITGTSWNLSVSNVPTAGTIGVDVFGLADPGLDDLAAIGLPDCGLRASLDQLTVFLVSGSTHTYSFALPTLPGVLGLHLYTTSAVLVSGLNAFGAVTGNGVDGRIGDF